MKWCLRRREQETRLYHSFSSDAVERVTENLFFATVSSIDQPQRYSLRSKGTTFFWVGGALTAENVCFLVKSLCKEVKSAMVVRPEKWLSHEEYMLFCGKSSEIFQKISELFEEIFDDFIRHFVVLLYCYPNFNRE